MSLNDLPEARTLERLLSFSFFSFFLLQPCTQVSEILAEMSVSPGSTSEVTSSIEVLCRCSEENSSFLFSSPNIWYDCWDVTIYWLGLT